MLNYSFSATWSDEDEGYIAICPEFPGLSAFGDTAEEAVAELKAAIGLAIETYQSEGWDVPQPQRIPEYGGKLLLRMPKSLHGKLAQQAEAEGVSLNTYVITILSEAIGVVSTALRVESVVTRTLTRLNARFVHVIQIMTQTQHAASGTMTMQLVETRNRYPTGKQTASAHVKSLDLQ